MSESNSRVQGLRCSSASLIVAVWALGLAASGQAQTAPATRLPGGNLPALKASALTPAVQTSNPKISAVRAPAVPPTDSLQTAAERSAANVVSPQLPFSQAQDPQILIALPPIAPLPGKLVNAKAIDSFLQRLPGKPGQTLHILQIGDSHTAGDLFTGAWRTAWQQQYGLGGRGVLPAGKPYRGYMTMGVTAAQSEGWTANALMGRQYAEDGPALGVTGFTQTARIAGAKLTLAADNSNFTFDKFSLCGVAGPEMGGVRVTLGSVTQEFSFFNPKAGAACFDIGSPALESMAQLETLSDQPVSLTSWSTMRRSGGLIISNLGVVGSRFQHFARNNDAVIALELARAHPDLLVVAFGTNEGFDSDLRIENTAAIMRAQIERIRTLLGYKVPVLVIGPPDVVTQKPNVALPSLPETVACSDGWLVPGNVMRMRQMEIDLAKEMDLAFWDWQGAMGGPCASLPWVAQGLQRKDHVHFTASGGRMLGRSLAADLDQARRDLKGS